MRGPGIAGTLGVVALLFLGWGSSADAATLKADYQFQGSRTSEQVGAPDLANIGAGNHFEVEAVDGVSRQVLVFPKGNGLSLQTQGLVDSRNHSVVMLFRLAEITGYRRILDFSGGTSDSGLYNQSGRAVLYGSSGASPGAVFSGNSYAQVVLTNAAVPGGQLTTSVYVNGVLVAIAKASEDFDLKSGVLRFFKDNVSGPASGEESAGAVACIRVYDGALTTDEVGQVAASGARCGSSGLSGEGVSGEGGAGNPFEPGSGAKVGAVGRPKAGKLGRWVVVDTGLVVSCPMGPMACSASGKLDVAQEQGAAANVKRLGAIRFSVPAGATGSILVPLTRPGIRALAEAGQLRIRASAEIAEVGKSSVAAQQLGTIKMPRSPNFRAGTYSGTTSQNLPIIVTVGIARIRSVYFRWRAMCSDGRVHTNSVLLLGERVRRGRFSFGSVLNSGGSVHVSGAIRDTLASGVLSRTGTTGSGARCSAKRIEWHARASGIEVDKSS